MQKGSLKASEENCSWRQNAPEDKALLKWWRVIRSCSSSEASSSEAVNHQKLQFIRRCKLKVSKVVQWIQCRLSIAKEWKRRATTNSKGFKSIGCLFFCRALTKYNCTKCTTTTPTTQSLSLLQDKDNSSACNNVPSYMEAFEIDPSYDNNHIRQWIIGDWSKLQTTLFGCAGNSQWSSRTSI